MVVQLHGGSILVVQFQWFSSGGSVPWWFSSMVVQFHGGLRVRKTFHPPVGFTGLTRVGEMGFLIPE